MRLETLDIHNVRNLNEQRLICAPGINIFTGKNAAGKTAILESIYLLAHASSFRTPRITEVIQHGKAGLAVAASLIGENQNQIRAGLEKGRQTTRIRFNGETINKRSEQARNIPIVAATQESQQLVSGSPQTRRHWLDWAMFHVEPGYMQTWQNYYYALRQRNALIRQNASNNHFVGWERQLAQGIVELRRKRSAYLKALNQEYKDVTRGGTDNLQMTLRTPEQTENETYEALQEQKKADMEAGYTRTGAHREDILFTINKQHEANRVLSRGQIKQMTLHILVSQAILLQKQAKSTPFLLIDDLCAELDKQAREDIQRLLQQRGLQAFITATEPEMFTAEGEQKRFHVEQGRITATI